MHTASPFQVTVEDPQRDLVDPALKGTLNVLSSATKVPNLKRVIVTSSVAAVIPENVDSNTVYTEEHWNNESSLSIVFPHFGHF